MFEGSVICVTGGSGSWGQELTKQLLERGPEKIIIFSRGELAQVNMQRKFNDPRVEFVIGDVRDYSALSRALKGVDFVFHCFPSGTEVVCENAIKNIEDVLIGDKVFSSDGSLNTVTDLLSRQYDGDSIEISLYHSNFKLKSTTEHPYLVWKPNKKCPKSYRTNCTPACNNKNKGSCPEHYRKDQECFVKAESIKKGDFIAVPRIKSGTLLTEYSNDMMRLFGYYLAEGSLSDRAVRFTFNSKEEEYLSDVESICLKAFGKKGSRYYSDHNSCTVTVCGKDIASRFLEFGKGAKNKKVPSWVFKLKDSLKIEQLLLGYFRGDGCYSNGKMTTISKELALQLRLLFGAIGIPTGLHKYKGRPFREGGACNTQYSVNISELNKDTRYYSTTSKDSYKTFVTEDYIFYLIKSVRRSRIKSVVYNLTVDGNHTYNVLGYAVHNCAALKHVPVCENHPQEAIKTNIDGTTNLVNAAIENGVKKVIDVSTDKSVSPTNLYGMTKAVGEKLVIQANNLTNHTDFVCIRAGNVLGSNGSVVPLFIDQIARYNKVTVTCGHMTRYFMTLPEAIHLLFKAAECSVGGETFVMHMPAFRISTLAEVLIDHYGNKETWIEEIGIREGEKIDELLISEHEAARSVIYDDDYYVIKTDLKINRDYSHLYDKAKVPFESYSSSYEIKDYDYLRDLLNRGGFLK